MKLSSDHGEESINPPQMDLIVGVALQEFTATCKSVVIIGNKYLLTTIDYYKQIAERKQALVPHSHTHARTSVVRSRLP